MHARLCMFVDVYACVGEYTLQLVWVMRTNCERTLIIQYLLLLRGAGFFTTIQPQILPTSHVPARARQTTKQHAINQPSDQPVPRLVAATWHPAGMIREAPHHWRPAGAAQPAVCFVKLLLTHARRVCAIQHRMQPVSFLVCPVAKGASLSC